MSSSAILANLCRSFITCYICNDVGSPIIRRDWGPINRLITAHVFICP